MPRLYVFKEGDPENQRRWITNAPLKVFTYLINSGYMADKHDSAPYDRAWEALNLFKEGKLPKIDKPKEKRTATSNGKARREINRGVYVNKGFKNGGMESEYIDLTPEEYKLMMREKAYEKVYKWKYIKLNDLIRIRNILNPSNIQASMPTATERGTFAEQKVSFANLRRGSVVDTTARRARSTNKSIWENIPDEDGEHGFWREKQKYGKNQDKTRYIIGSYVSFGDAKNEDGSYYVLISPLKYKSMIDKQQYEDYNGSRYLFVKDLPKNLKNQFNSEEKNLPNDIQTTSRSRQNRAQSRLRKRSKMAETQIVPHPLLNQSSVVKLKLSPSQLKKVKYGHTVLIKPDQVNHPQSNFNFPNLGRHNRALLHEALNDGKRKRIILMDQELEGSGIKEFFRGVGRFFKDNWKTIKPIVSAVADVALPAIGTAFGSPQSGVLGRQLIKQTTGVGVGGSFKAKGLARARKTGLTRSLITPQNGHMYAGRLVKGSAEAKAHMAKLRLMRSGKTKATARTATSNGPSSPAQAGRSLRTTERATVRGKVSVMGDFIPQPSRMGGGSFLSM